MIHFIPHLHITKYELKKLIGKPPKEIYASFEAMRVAVKKATGYGLDNSHFYIDDIFGKPALKIHVHPKGMDFWNAKTDTRLNLYATTFTEETLTEIEHAIRQIENGLVQCNKCGEWVKDYKPYSYAGAVCEKCYDPKTHRLPDTRGDN